YDCINKYVPRCISIEISVDGARMNVDDWREALSNLASLSTLPTASDLTFYRYTATILTDQADELGLKALQLEPFKPIPEAVAKSLGAATPAYPIFVGKNYKVGTYMGVLNDA